MGGSLLVDWAGYFALGAPMGARYFTITEYYYYRPLLLDDTRYLMAALAKLGLSKWTDKHFPVAEIAWLVAGETPSLPGLWRTSSTIAVTL